MKKGIFGAVLCLALNVVATQMQQLSTTYIRETPEDVKEALVNFPERVPGGPQVRTLYGKQLVLGDVRSDLRINQIIYDDIATVQIIMQRLIQLIINLGTDPSLLDSVKRTMAHLFVQLDEMGKRYGLRTEFAIKKNELTQLLTEVIQSSRSTDYMLFRFRLETTLAEIENILKTKFVR